MFENQAGTLHLPFLVRASFCLLLPSPFLLVLELVKSGSVVTSFPSGHLDTQKMDSNWQPFFSDIFMSSMATVGPTSERKGKKRVVDLLLKLREIYASKIFMKIFREGREGKNPAKSAGSTMSPSRSVFKYVEKYD